MKKFKIKNRQKRKYTRHAAVPQSTFSFRALFVSLLPMLVLAFVFATMLLINLNLREKPSAFQPSFEAPSLPTFRIPEITFPTLTLPTITAPQITFPTITWPQVALPEAPKPPQADISVSSTPFVGFFSAVGLAIQTMVILFGKAFIAFFVIPDTRPLWGVIGQGIMSMFYSMGLMGNLMMSGFIRVWELLIQSISLVGVNISLGSLTVSAAAVEYAVRAGHIIAVSSIFVFEKVAWALTALFTGTIMVIMFIVNAIVAFTDAVVRFISIPFQILGAFWIKIKPYVDILGDHMQMAGADLSNGVNSFNELGEAMTD